jgi:hypothetical protein
LFLNIRDKNRKKNYAVLEMASVGADWRAAFKNGGDKFFNQLPQLF